MGYSLDFCGSSLEASDDSHPSIPNSFLRGEIVNKGFLIKLYPA